MPLPRIGRKNTDSRNRSPAKAQMSSQSQPRKLYWSEKQGTTDSMQDDFLQLANSHFL